MNIPGQSVEISMLSYDFAHWMGKATGGDINFKKLAEQLDCSRDFFQVGIIYDDGAQRWIKKYPGNL
ncbi:hypothetical protein N5923_11900 [Erwiniaceae bacterium BAC15a-03b]|uniref:Uncharacterized protein n=1 Tax=Winslowiella arboricola TaxID=2978220 RepID=A0A9J6PIN8_9GAMM|nr:hypothetical protein [Winslowiella arboricola]MCU5771444.1 hypothetical protein [Winslowiella arboricola]MCU5778193.1 hypothetical protein [Winslowiella arboricola]